MANPNEIQIADAVVAALNGQKWTRTFTAARVFRPISTLTEVGAGVVVSVVPGSWETERVTRAKFDDEIRIDVGIQNKPSEFTNALIDPVYTLVVAVREFLRGKIGTVLGPGTALRIEHSPIWSPSHIREHGTLTSVLRVFFSVTV